MCKMTIFLICPNYSLPDYTHKHASKLFLTRKRKRIILISFFYVAFFLKYKQRSYSVSNIA